MSVPSHLEDALRVIVSPDETMSAKQPAMAHLLAHLLTHPCQGRPFIFSAGELRRAIRLAEQESGNDEVLNYEHPLLEDPVVSCASKQQLLGNLQHRFNYCPACEAGTRCGTHCPGCLMGSGCPDHG